MGGRTVHLRIRVAVGAAALLLAAPGVALAAGKPIATTGGAASITQSTVTLTGTVTPNGAATTYFFQYGPTSLYGATTPAATAGKKMIVAVPVGGLAPFTTYHYRLIAQNTHGLSKGKDRTFKTKRQPLGVSLIATPNPVPFGRPTTLQGILSGTGNAGRSVVLQSNPFPYTQGFVNATNAQVTNAQGVFSFPLLSLPVNTQFRVVLTDKPTVASPIIVAYSKVRVTEHRKRSHTRRGKVIRFYGSVSPANDSAPFAIQRFSKGQWRTVTGGITHHHSASSSSYSKRVRIRHSGSYRVFVEIANGQYTSAAGATMHVRR
jgi:hypothetical protein